MLEVSKITSTNSNLPNYHNCGGKGIIIIAETLRKTNELLDYKDVMNTKVVLVGDRLALEIKF